MPDNQLQSVGNTDAELRYFNSVDLSARRFKDLKHAAKYLLVSDYLSVAGKTISGNKVPDEKELDEIIRRDIGGDDETAINDYMTVVGINTKEDRDGDFEGFDPYNVNARLWKDTTLGGTDVINPLPQACRDDDVIHSSGSTFRGDQSGDPYGDTGMGRLYSEVYDANQQVIEFMCGTAKYEGLLDFMSEKSTDKLLEILSWNGDDEGKGVLNWITGMAGDAVKTAAGTAKFLAIDVPLAPFTLAANMFKEGRRSGISKYVTFEAAMFPYYASVNTILVSLAQGMGLIPNTMGELPSDKSWEDFYAQWETAGEDLPEIFRQKLDIFSILNKRSAHIAKNTKDRKTLVDYYNSINKNRNKMKKLQARFADAEKKLENADTEKQEEAREEYLEAKSKLQKESSLTHFNGVVKGGRDFVRFRVNKADNAQESITNTLGDSPVKQKVDAIQDKGQELSQNRAGMVGTNDRKNNNFVESITKAGFDTVTKGMNWLDTMKTSLQEGTLAVGALKQLASGEGRIDVPKIWKDSSFSKSYTFTISLRATHSDPISIFQEIYIPMAMWFAATFPRQTNKETYTHPPYLRMYSKGQFTIPIGMVTSMNIKRGGDDYGWTYDNLPTAVDLEITVEDLSSVLFLSLSDDKSLLREIFQSNTNMIDYLNVLSGLSAHEQFSSFKSIVRKSKIAFELSKMRWTSAHYFTQNLAHSGLADTLFAAIPLGQGDTPEYQSSMTKTRPGVY